MPKKFYLLLIALPLIAGMGLNFSCEEIIEKDGIDQMLQIISAVSMVEGEAGLIASSLPQSIRKVEASKVSVRNAVQSVSNDGLELGLNMLGIKTPFEVSGTTGVPEIVGPSAKGWYSLKFAMAESQEGMEIDIDINAKARLLNGSTPVSVDITALTSANPTEEQIMAVTDSLKEQVDGATSLGVQVRINGDIYATDGGVNSAELKNAHADLDVTVNLASALDLGNLENPIPDPTSVELIVDVGSIITVFSEEENIDCKANVRYVINADINDPAKSTGEITISLSTGFMYMDTYRLHADVNADGSTSGTITHNSESISFSCTDGNGTYTYKNIEYDMSTGEPVS